MTRKAIVCKGLVLLVGLLMISSFVTSSVLADWALLPKTGQTTSYATGDDGDLEMGIAWPNPRFTDNGDGTVTDNLTGLIWLKDAYCFEQERFSGALSRCNGLANYQCNLSDGSFFGDWRLPNVNELRSLIDLTQVNPALPPGHPFDNVYYSESYKTSTKSATGQFFEVSMGSGKWRRAAGDGLIPMWCVRGTSDGPAPVPKTGQTTSYATGDDGDLEMGVAWPNPRFTDNGNGTVTDNLTGLIWMKNANCFGQRTWSQALTNCLSLASGGPCGITDGSYFGDWRLPNRNELESLYRFEVHTYPSPSLPDTAGTGRWSQGDPFNNVRDQSWAYWSSTTGSPGYYTEAWVAYLSFYSSDWLYDKSFTWSVWCVRGGDSDEDAIPDHDDNCPDDYNPGQEDTDNSGIGDICNDAFDTDGDEWEDGFDNCPEDYNPNQEDVGDADGVGDVCDNCPDDANSGQEDADGDDDGDVCDDCTDTDDDGYGNPGYPNLGCDDDNCPDDPNSGQEDTDGSGIGDICNDAFDVDGDEWEDSLDNCPDDPNPNQEDLGDADGVGDVCDNCPDNPNPGQEDADGDDDGDECDNCPDDPNPGQEDVGDADGVGDVCDNCPDDPNLGQEDADGDTVGDVCDDCTDTDDDNYGNPGYPANTCPDDNCPNNYNPEQEDTDGDDIGDVCEDCTDTDDDGYGNPGYLNPGCDDDNCPDDYNPGQEDLDTDTIGDACDDCTDTDDDGYGNPGYPNLVCDDDNCPDDANSGQEDLDTDAVGDVCDDCTDTDDDGYGNPGYPNPTCDDDNCPNDANPDQEDTGDGDGVGDLCDNCFDISNPDQEDTYPPEGNECGDICECEGNFDDDVDQDGSNAATFKADFGRSPFSRPCTNGDPCNGDFDCDVDVDGTDASKFKDDFGRSEFFNPCPICPTDPWCEYPG